MHVDPSLIDDYRNRRGAYPRDSLRYDALINPIEYMPTIAEGVLDEATLGDLVYDTVLPFLDALVATEVVPLSALDFHNGAASVGGDGTSLAKIVRRVTEDLGELSL